MDYATIGLILCNATIGAPFILPWNYDKLDYGTIGQSYLKEHSTIQWLAPFSLGTLSDWLDFWFVLYGTMGTVLTNDIFLYLPLTNYAVLFGLR